MRPREQEQATYDNGSQSRQSWRWWSKEPERSQEMLDLLVKLCDPQKHRFLPARRVRVPFQRVIAVEFQESDKLVSCRCQLPGEFNRNRRVVQSMNEQYRSAQFPRTVKPVQLAQTNTVRDS